MVRTVTQCEGWLTGSLSFINFFQYRENLVILKIHTLLSFYFSSAFPFLYSDPFTKIPSPLLLHPSTLSLEPRLYVLQIFYIVKHSISLL